VVTNAVWVTISKYSGPLIALIFYAIIAFLCWKRRHFHAGIIGGIVGFGIHTYELIFQGLEELSGVILVLFFVNLILPILLIYFSYRVCHELKQKFADKGAVNN